MTFEQQIKDIAHAAAAQMAGQIEERLLGLATEVSQVAATDRVSVVRELRLAAEAEVAKRSQEAVAAAQNDHARRLEEAVSLARQEAGRRLDESLAAARAEQARRTEEAVAAARAELTREKEAALGALRVELGREHDAAVAAVRTEFGPQVEAALAAARVEASRTLADSLSQSRTEADQRLAHAVDQARREAWATADQRLAQAVDDARREAAGAAERTVVDARVTERQKELAQIERLRDAIRRIDAAKSLTDALDALAESAGREAPRVAVFVLRGSRLAGWRHSGFPPGIDPSRMEVAADHPGLLSRALRAGRAVATSEGPAGDAAFVTPFGSLPDDCAGLAVPVRIGGETVAIVYADDAVAGHEVPNAFPEVVEMLACHAARCLEVLTLTRAASQTAQAAPARPARPAAPAPSVTPQAPVRAPSSTPSSMPALMSAPTSALADAPHAPRYAPTTRSFQATGDEDEDAARRYARLLVSEIKLYHEAAVAEGRRNHNLLERLRPEIDRAQRLYEERVPVQIRLKADFFGQELVRTLAGGDPTALGGR